MTAARQTTTIVAAACGAIVAAIALQVARDRWYPRSDLQAAEILYVRSGPVLQRLALDYDGLLADVYWVRAIQYYGGNRLLPPQQRHHYELLYPMLDIATTLDPYFNIAYRFGAIFLGEGYPGGPARPDQAVALLRKGLAVRPDKWQYSMDIGFVYYWRLRDYTSAAQWIERASAQPNAPSWLGPLAATMLVHGGDRASARFLWRQIAQSEEEWLRRSAARALLQLDALDQIDRLDQIVRRYPPPAGQPRSWSGLIRRGVLPGLPVDPSRTAYDIDPATGRVSVSESSPLYPLPLDAARRGP